ncbi:PfkB family carbohydrate kinase [Succinatimonas hippei]|uniref:PfkB family carbohydrate kinase n=1 Tax=Succinatimonas hippei TaxID=626938 RepID=UPI0024903DC0|nr:PfkB family carbohydrate kinase [Succinatimonas hippei]
MKILCVGISVQDRIFSVDSLPKEEGKFFARNFKEQGGGPAATAAVACARLGINTDMIARVGDDVTGEGIIAELKSEGVNVEKMRVIKNAISTQASILVDKKGNRIIVSYPSPSLDIDASFMDAIDFSQYDIVLADVRWHEGALKAFELAKKAGVPTVLDADTTPQPIDALVKLSSHAVFSKPGLIKFTECLDINKALKIAEDKTDGRVYVTLGDDGYSYIENGIIKHKNGFKVKVVDTTGAGDVFHGAFACALCLGYEIEPALKFAAATAALKCTKAGGRSGIPTINEVKEFCFRN